MRVIEEEMLKAVRSNKNFSCGNTSVVVENNIVSVFLHGHRIYGKNTKTGKEFFSDCGYKTKTTKSRLNALGAGVYQKDFSWYTQEGEPWKNGKLDDIM